MGYGRLIGRILLQVIATRSLLTHTPIAMAETKEQQEQRALRELEAKNIAHYSVMLQAWIETRMARDKSLITLSAGGVGVLVTLLTTVGLARPWQIWLYAGSFLGFLATIGIALVIYQKNAELIENDFRGDVKDLKLKTFDIASIATFYVGAIFAVLIAISSALTQPTKKGDYGMGETMKKSLDGISNLKPQPPHEPPPAAPSAQQSPAATTPAPVADSPKK